MCHVDAFLFYFTKNCELIYVGQTGRRAGGLTEGWDLVGESLERFMFISDLFIY